MAQTLSHFKREAALIAGSFLLLYLTVFGDIISDAANSVARAALFLVLVALILAIAFRAISHAGELAGRYGEPQGSLLLTLSMLSIEVSLIVSVMLTGLTQRWRGTPCLQDLC